MASSPPTLSVERTEGVVRFMLRCVVYRQCGTGAPVRIHLADGFTCSFWHPGLFRMVPADLPWFPFVVWWVMHFLRVFTNRGYSVLLIHRSGELVHRSVVFPRYFRFPFVGKDDLQIGDTWTAEGHRGKGLAGFAIQAILDRDPRPDWVYWYVCEATNVASIRVVEKLGFRKVGDCVRVSRFGVRLLGAFILAEPTTVRGVRGSCI